ncbi:hypothetical protein V6N11_025784 [Hibiscus sabdariffa]|uniref:Uncharacterized protein n=1 Tax=Hibiscus sabdariffa TaxID=183260 RepID=A0ABR2STN7_9ROSI
MPAKVRFLASCKILDVELSSIVTNVELLLSLHVIQSPLYSYDGLIPLEPFLNKIRFILTGSRSTLSTGSVVAYQNRVCKVGSHGKMKCEKEILPLQALKTGLCSPPKGKGNLDEMRDLP